MYGNQLSQSELLTNMDVADIEKFRGLVADLGKQVEDAKIIDRRVIFKVNQLQNLDNRDLEIQISKSKGEGVIERWN